MSTTASGETSIGVTAFKGQCLALIEEVAQGKTRRVVLLKHNRPVAAIVPIEQEPVELWGAMRGSVRVAPGVDLTAGTGDAWEAER
jgi:antitoxin (DNA-binding transcriptional repressor) of toxin-antitoxin stability system